MTEGSVDCQQLWPADTTASASADGKKCPMTDTQIIDLVREALCSSGYDHLRTLQAYCEDGRVTLQGRVPTYYLKQVAQSVLRTLSGVRGIDNEVDVTMDAKNWTRD